MRDFQADIKRARVLTVLMLRTAADDGRSVGEACALAQAYLESHGYAAPDDPIAFATCGKIAMDEADPRAQLVALPSGEVI